LDGRILVLRQGQLEKMPYTQLESPLRDGAAVRWSRLKIATNVVGVICSSEPRKPPVRLS
jgi:hypothetical protein